jgi:hypothetical protein
MEVPIGTYHTVPEFTLFVNVMDYRGHGFLERDELVNKLATLKGIFHDYTRFIEAGCPTPYSEWPIDSVQVTKEEALDYWDEVRQHCHVIEKAIAFVESDAGKREAHYESLRRELRYLERTLDDIGGTTSSGNLRGLLNHIQSVEEDIEDMDRDAAEGYRGTWILEGGPSMKNYMNYAVGSAWREAMESMGRTSATVLHQF